MTSKQHNISRVRPANPYYSSLDIKSQLLLILNPSNLGQLLPRLLLLQIFYTSEASTRKTVEEQWPPIIRWYPVSTCQWIMGGHDPSTVFKAVSFTSVTLISAMAVRFWSSQHLQTLCTRLEDSFWSSQHLQKYRDLVLDGISLSYCDRNSCHWIPISHHLRYDIRCRYYNDMTHIGDNGNFRREFNFLTISKNMVEMVIRCTKSAMVIMVIRCTKSAMAIML